MNALEAWGWLPPSQWMALSLEEKALLAEFQVYIANRRKEQMKK